MRKFLFLCLTMLFSLVTQGLWATDDTDAAKFTGDYECVFIHATDADGNTCMVSNEFYYEASAGETKKFNYADPLSGVTTGEGEEAVTTHYVTVNGVKLSTGLKMEGSTEIDFTITEEMGTMDLQIIIDTKSGNSNTPAIKVDGETYSELTQRSTDSSADDFGGYEITITLAPGDHTIKQGGNQDCLMYINLTKNETEETEPGPTEGSSLDLYTEVEDNTYAITKEASWFAENGFDDWGSDQYSGTIDAGTVVYEDDIIKIETATDTYAGNFGNKASDMKADFPTYTGYTLSGTTLEVNFTDEVRIYDPSSIAANNQGVLMVTPTVDGELAFGVYAGDNKRTIGIYELATEEEIAAGTERAWVAINTFKHGGAEDEDSTDPTVEKGAPGYVSGSVTANRQYLLVGGSNKNLTLHQITFVPTEEEETEPGPVEEGLLYSTDFTDWETIDRTEANGDEVTVTTTTGGDLTFTLWGVGVDPTKTDSSKFPDYVGAMITSKYAEDGSAEYSVYEPFAVTSTLGTVDKIVFTQVATGNNRGIKVSVKGDGDEDWVVLYNETIHTASGETIELDGIDKTNCRIKFESFALAQNGYIADLKIYGTDFTGEEVDPYEDLYDEIRMDVDALGVDLTYAWANINLEHPESVEGLQSTYDAIKDEITNLQLVVEASHDGEELTADQASIEAQVEVIKAEIDALEAAATSINSITIDSNFEGKSIYTISGQKVAAPTKAGIYIIDGKKVVIK